MKSAWWDFLNGAEFHSTTVIFVMLLVIPLLVLFLIFLFRRPLSRIDKSWRRFILGTLGGLILALELTQDIQKVFVRIDWNNGDVALAIRGQVFEMLELCRLNTLLLGLFLIFNKIDWVKYVAAAALFGGLTTIYSEATDGSSVAIWGAIKHSIVLCVVPALAISMQNKKYTLKELGIAHIVNYVYVAIVVSINYSVPMSDGTMTRSIGNLNEIGLGKDNPITDWAPYGSRIFIYVLVVTITFWIWWGVESLIRKHTNYNRPINYLWNRKQA